MWGVTGAGGRLGRAVIDELKELVPAGQIVALSRRPEELSDLAQDGVELRSVDFDQSPSRLREAFAGVQQMLLVSTDGVGTRLSGHLAAISAAQDAGVERLVYTSVPQPVPANPALVAAEHRATEDAIRESGMKWTMLRNALYSDLQVPDLLEAARTGEFWTNTAAGASGYVTRLDCAAVAANILAQGGYDGVALDVTGPEALDSAELARIAEELGGRKVKVVEMDDLDFGARLIRSGVPEAIAKVIASMGAGVREGFFGQVTSVVQDTTGRPPVSVREAVRKNAGRP